MRNAVLGSFFGCMFAAGVLAACGGGGAILATALQALDVMFDNTSSGMVAENVQDALDETAARMDMAETDAADLDGRLTTAENSAATLGGKVSTVEVDLAALEATAGSHGHVFVRWGNTSAPTGTTKVYSGIAVVSPTTGRAFVMNGGDPGGTVGSGHGGFFLATKAESNWLPPGITGDRRLVAAVCYSPTATTIIYGTHTAPTGWKVLYKGYLMGYEKHQYCVDSVSFDASGGAAGTESVEWLATTRLQATHDSTNYPADRYVKAAVIAKN